MNVGLHRKIEDFLLHGVASTEDYTVKVKEEAQALLGCRARILADQEEQHAAIVSFEESSTKLHNDLLSCKMETKLKEIRVQQLMKGLMTMACAVEHLWELHEPLNQINHRQQSLDIEDIGDGQVDHATSSAIINKVQLKAAQTDAIKAIPARVLEVFRCVPRSPDIATLCTIPKKSKVLTNLNTHVKNLKSTVLSQFQRQFEDILSLSGKDGADASGGSGSAQIWQDFLHSSRDWLLAYGLLSILPVAITEPPTAVHNAYIQAIDEALTPLWGRFRFHLKQASGASMTSVSKVTTANNMPETGSSNHGISGSKHQVLWTFQYCKIFAQLLIDLCDQMTTTINNNDNGAGISKEEKSDGAVYLNELLKELPRSHSDDPTTSSELNAEILRFSSQNFLLNKCIRFFQAHIADVLMLATSNSGLHSIHQRSYVHQLVERSLALDDTLVHLLNRDTRCTRVRNQVKPFHLEHSCIDVFCAAKPVFISWVQADTEYIRKTVSKILNLPNHNKNDRTNSISNTIGLFSNIFKNAFNPSLKLYYGNNDIHKVHSGLQCYHGPYEIMRLFLVSSQRYSAIPKVVGHTVQTLFATYILEPLLHLIVSMLLLRLRSSTALHDLSEGILPVVMRQSLLVEENKDIIKKNYKNYLKYQEKYQHNRVPAGESFFDKEDNDCNSAEYEEGEPMENALQGFTTIDENNDNTNNAEVKNIEQQESINHHEIENINNGDVHGVLTPSSQESFPVANITDTNLPDSHVQEVLNELKEFYDTIDYIEQALHACGAEIRDICCCSNNNGGTITSRYESTWRDIHAWLPHEVPSTAPRGDVRSNDNSAAAAMKQRDILEKLLDKALPACDEGEAYAAIAALKTKTFKDLTNLSVEENKESTLAKSIDLCRAQIVVLKQVLVKKEAKARKRLSI